MLCVCVCVCLQPVYLHRNMQHRPLVSNRRRGSGIIDPGLGREARVKVMPLATGSDGQDERLARKRAQSAVRSKRSEGPWEQCLGKVQGGKVPHTTCQTCPARGAEDANGTRAGRPYNECSFLPHLGFYFP